MRPESGPTAAEFDRLQGKLRQFWPTIRALNDEPQTIVVVPALSLDLPPDIVPLVPAYEERYLFLALLLRQPKARVVYVTSSPVPEERIRYYLSLHPDLEDARPRFVAVDAGDPSGRSLTDKVLDQPEVLSRIASAIEDTDRAHLVPFVATESEARLAVALGIPMYGAAPAHLHFGTKSGSRLVFAETGVPHPEGVEGVRTRAEVRAALARIRGRRPMAAAAVVKHDDGVGGLGNGQVRLDDGDLDAAVDGIVLDDPAVDAAWFYAELERRGGVVEERVAGDEVRSPSAQLRVHPDGEVELLSTHDQVLGGATGQGYLGCRFPADPAYAPAIARHARAVGARLARDGVLGRFAVDFVAVRDGDAWSVHAIEINLRKGGTTHPFLTLQLLTDGRYDDGAATFSTEDGATRAYVASDHVDVDPALGLTSGAFHEFAAGLGLAWDPAARAGVVFHMVGALDVAGRVGLTAIGESEADAQARFDAAVAALRG